MPCYVYISERPALCFERKQRNISGGDGRGVDRLGGVNKKRTEEKNPFFLGITVQVMEQLFGGYFV